MSDGRVMRKTLSRSKGAVAVRDTNDINENRPPLRTVTVNTYWPQQCHLLTRTLKHDSSQHGFRHALGECAEWRVCHPPGAQRVV